MTIYLNYIDNYFSISNNNNTNNINNINNTIYCEKEKNNNKYEFLENIEHLSKNIIKQKKNENNKVIINNEKYNIINSHNNNNNDTLCNNDTNNNNIKFGLGKIKYSDEICLKVKTNNINDKLLDLIEDFDWDKNRHKNIIFENLNKNANLKFNVSLTNWKKFCKNINILVFNGNLINYEFKIVHLLYCKTIKIFIINNLKYNLFQENNDEEYYVNILNLKKLRIFEVNIDYINPNFELYNKLKNILQNKNVKLSLNYL